ncbi:MAG: PRC-barrel domain-containing protein [Bacteroidales bacterium]|nr:PRC-barrel domain-containing protein [Bacteroidales bacterium]
MFAVAQVLKSNGTDGELLVSFRGTDPEDINVKEPVFIEFDGLPVPFFIESLTPRGNNRALIRLTGIHNLKDAEEVTGRQISIEDDGSSEEETSIIGWTLLDGTGRQVGTITDFEDIPGNTCLYVDTTGGEVLLPFHEDLVIDINEETRTLTLTIPDGLL